MQLSQRDVMQLSQRDVMQQTMFNVADMLNLQLLVINDKIMAVGHYKDLKNKSNETRALIGLYLSWHSSVLADLSSIN